MVKQPSVGARVPQTWKATIILINFWIRCRSKKLKCNRCHQYENTDFQCFLDVQINPLFFSSNDIKPVIRKKKVLAELLYPFTSKVTSIVTQFHLE